MTVCYFHPRTTTADIIHRPAVCRSRNAKFPISDGQLPGACAVVEGGLALLVKGISDKQLMSAISQTDLSLWRSVARRTTYLEDAIDLHP